MLQAECECSHTSKLLSFPIIDGNMLATYLWSPSMALLTVARNLVLAPASTIAVRVMAKLPFASDLVPSLYKMPVSDKSQSM